MPARLLLEQQPLVRSRSIEESRVIFCSATDSPVELTRLDRRPFEWRANRATFGPIGIMATSHGGGVRGVSSGATHYHLLLAQAGKSRATQGDAASELLPGESLTVLNPGAPSAVEVGAGYRGLQFSVPAALVSSTFLALTGRIKRPTFVLHSDVRTSAAEVARLLLFMIHEADRQSAIVTAPAANPMAEALAMLLLHRLAHDQSRWLDTPIRAAEPRYVRNAEELLLANITQPVTLAQLVEHTGVSGRTLQKGFRAHRGCSPTAFLRARRFELARRQLQIAPSGASIATIAFACGFEHLGRFSVGYRRLFGESPRDTLRRSRHS